MFSLLYDLGDGFVLGIICFARLDGTPAPGIEDRQFCGSRCKGTGASAPVAGWKPCLVLMAFSRLERTGWVYCHLEPGRVRGRLVYPWMPPDLEQHVGSLLTQRRTTVAYFSEWLMRCLLDFLVADWEYLDNAYPDWLITPQGARLQLERWYVNADVAFEFQGPQHYQKGDRFVRTDDELSRRLQYDGAKIRLCSLQGIDLIEVRGFDLEFEVFQEQIRGKLPLIPVRQTGPLFRQLLGMSRQYVNHLRSN